MSPQDLGSYPSRRRLSSNSIARDSSSSTSNMGEDVIVLYLGFRRTDGMMIGGRKKQADLTAQGSNSLQLDPAPVSLNGAFDDRQPQSAPRPPRLARRRSPIERFENGSCFLIRNARATIFNGQFSDQPSRVAPSSG